MAHARMGPAIPDFGAIASRNWGGGTSADIYSRGMGEAVWRHPHHRLVVPLTKPHARRAAVQVEGGRTNEFVWHDLECGGSRAPMVGQVIPSANQSG